MKARTHNPRRLVRLNRRLGNEIHGNRLKRDMKRGYRGGAPANANVYAVAQFIGKNHHEPLHEAKQRPIQPRKPALRPQQAPDMWPDMSILAVAAQAKRKRMVR